MLPWEPPADELSDLPAAKETEEKENMWLPQGVNSHIIKTFGQINIHSYIVCVSVYTIKWNGTDLKEEASWLNWPLIQRSFGKKGSLPGYRNLSHCSGVIWSKSQFSLFKSFRFYGSLVWTLIQQIFNNKGLVYVSISSCFIYVMFASSLCWKTAAPPDITTSTRHHQDGAYVVMRSRSCSWRPFMLSPDQDIFSQYFTDLSKYCAVNVK